MVLKNTHRSKCDLDDGGMMGDGLWHYFTHQTIKRVGQSAQRVFPPQTPYVFKGRFRQLRMSEHMADAR